jgi:uncharacterized protein YebE (UPF0316 family)
MDAIIGGLFVFVARVVNVSMATVRSLLGMRGQKRLAAAFGFFESLIFILAISKVLQNASNIWNILGYCTGFAVGTLVGLEVEEKLALGYAVVQAISQQVGREIAEALRAAGYGVTEMLGKGMSGEVQVITVVANRKDVPAVLSMVSDIDASAFVTVDDAAGVQRGYVRKRRNGEA